MICFSIGLHAQLDDRAVVNESPDPEEIAAIINDLPQVRHLSAALAEPVSHQDSVLTVIAVARLLNYGARLDSGDFDTLSDRFRDERAWLDRLATRFETIPRHAPVYDPPSWYLMQELAQHRLRPSENLAPLGPGIDMMLELARDGTSFRPTASQMAAHQPAWAIPEFLCKKR